MVNAHANAQLATLEQTARSTTHVPSTHARTVVHHKWLTTLVLALVQRVIQVNSVKSTTHVQLIHVRTVVHHKS